MKVAVGQIYYKPLLPGEVAKEVQPESILRRLKNEVLKQVKKALTQSAFSDKAKIALAKALKIEVKQSSLNITASHPAFMSLLKGSKKHQMTWLVKAKKPIPIVTESGEVIFRTASPRSMDNGKWIHPGRAPMDFMAKAKKTAKENVRSRVSAEIKRQMKAGLMGRR